MWKAEACKMPSWWMELMAVREVEDHKKLAQKIQASFQLPKRASKLHKMENYHQTPPALLFLLRGSFLPPPDSIFACQDIWEMQWEKMVAYAQSLQYWVEKTDLPSGGRPCLLVESVKDCKKRWGITSHSNIEEVLKGVIPLGETSTIPTEEADHQSTTTSARIPKGKAIKGAARESAVERKSPKFLRWEKVLHPSWPVVAAGLIPCPSRGPKLREEWVVQIPQTKLSKKMTTPQEAPSPSQELEVVWQVTPIPSFLGVMVCLRRDPPSKEAHKVSPNPLAVGVMSTPGVATMSTSCIMKDEVTGITYMDSVITLVGRVALSGPEQETPAQGPKNM